MSYLDTFTPPADWSKSVRAVVTWMKKNYTKAKRASVTCEQQVLLHVLTYLSDESKAKKQTLDYRDLKEFDLNGDFDAMHTLACGMLELDRNAACHYINVLLAANKTSLAEIWQKSQLGDDYA